jgi:hypothetical protein
MNMTAQGPNGRTGHKEVTGDTPDISEFIGFNFYDWVWYWDTPNKENSPKMGRWLGLSHRIGAAMCYFVLVSNGEVISRTSVQHVTKLEMMQDEIKLKMEAYNNEVQELLCDEGFECRHEMENAFYIDDKDIDEVLEPEEPTEIDKAKSFTPEAYDEYIGAQVMILYQDGWIQGTIAKRAKGNNGNPIGRRNDNIYLDTQRYEIELSNGTTEEYNANVIAENLFSQVGLEGHQYVLMREISDHQKDEMAVPIADGWITMANGQKVRKRTTRGWKLLVEWKEGGSDRIPLKRTKASRLPANWVPYDI